MQFNFPRILAVGFIAGFAGISASSVAKADDLKMMGLTNTYPMPLEYRIYESPVVATHKKFTVVKGHSFGRNHVYLIDTPIGPVEAVNPLSD